MAKYSIFILPQTTLLKPLEPNRWNTYNSKGNNQVFLQSVFWWDCQFHLINYVTFSAFIGFKQNCFNLFFIRKLYKILVPSFFLLCTLLCSCLFVKTYTSNRKLQVLPSNTNLVFQKDKAIHIVLLRTPTFKVILLNNQLILLEGACCRCCSMKSFE